MRFTKMQGCGNDYIFVDCFQEKPPIDPAALSRAISDRHYGVGADGLILIGRSENADARMRMFNADGSEAEMCGNGVRCVAKYVYDHGIARRTPLKIETGRGVLTFELEIESGKVRQVRVDMGAPILDSAAIPTTFPGPRVVNQTLPDGLIDATERWVDESGLDTRVTCVSMGNPHAVFFCRKVAAVPLPTIGPVLERAVLFPRRINVHFVEVHGPGEVTMRTWERGSGITLACGTGACAVCVAGVLTERTGRDLLAHLPGGDLRLQWSPSDHHVFMTGPAVEIFTGVWADA